jgi:glutaconate CoA-transferase, subunit A
MKARRAGTVEVGVLSKLATLAAAAALIPDGATVAFGGSLLHRAPSALTRELARQQRRDLTFVKPSAAYDVDLLCAAGCLRTVYAGIVAMEGGFGLAPSYRRAVESGRVRVQEHA